MLLLILYNSYFGDTYSEYKYIYFLWILRYILGNHYICKQLHPHAHCRIFDQYRILINWKGMMQSIGDTASKSSLRYIKIYLAYKSILCLISAIFYLCTFWSNFQFIYSNLVHNVVRNKTRANDSWKLKYFDLL